MNALNPTAEKEEVLPPDEVLKAKTSILPLLGMAVSDPDLWVRVEALRDVQSITEPLNRTSEELKTRPSYKNLISAIVNRRSADRWRKPSATSTPWCARSQR